MDYLDGTHDEYDISLRVVRFEISSGTFVNIITNLPDDEFSEEDFMDLYHLRWKQEGAFRDLKYPLCLRNFHSRKADYVEQEIWARAILYNFSSVIASGVKVEKRRSMYTTLIFQRLPGSAGTSCAAKEMERPWMWRG